MTKYCPLCENEYQDSVSNCVDDGEKLFDLPSPRIDKALSDDVYAAANEIEAECIVAFLLDLEVPAQVFRPQVAPLPNLSEAHFLVAVRKDDRKVATDAIRQAQADGVISNTGIFL
jgi:hypothetical protein